MSDGIYPQPIVRGLVSKSAQPTVDTAAYAAGDAVGGLLTFAGIARGGGAVVEIVQVVVTDLAKQNAPLDLVLFDRAFTPTTDNTPFDPADADLPNLVGILNVVAADYASFNDNSAAIKKVSVFCKPNTADLFGQLVARGTPTYAAATDLQIKLTAIQE